MAVGGPHEVRIAVEAAAISYADLLVMQGVHPERRRPPFVPGWDVVGRVQSTGPAVSGIAVGDRVAGLSIVGGWAEQVECVALRYGGDDCLITSGSGVRHIVHVMQGPVTLAEVLAATEIAESMTR